MKHSKSSLFLMELIIALFFFSLASTVCIRLFVKSHTMSTQTNNINYAVTQAQNLAEAFLGFEGDMEQLQLLYEGSELSHDNRLLTIYDDSYCCVLLLTPQTTITSTSMEGVVSADIMVYYQNASEPVFSLHVDHHIAERMVSYE